MAAHIPSQLMSRSNRATKVPSHLIPSSDRAVMEYRLNGGRITDPEDPAIADPLSDPVKRDIRLESFSKRFPSFDCIFYSVVNENTSVFADALTFFINVTFRLCHS